MTIPDVPSEPFDRMTESQQQSQESAVQRSLSDAKLEESKEQRDSMAKSQSEKDRDATQVARDTTQVHRDATQVARDATQVDRDETQVARDATQVAREATQANRDQTQRSRDATQVVREEEVIVQAKGRESKRKQQLGAYVLIVVAGLLGFYRTDQLRQQTQAETRRAIIAECNTIAHNSTVLLNLIDSQTSQAAPTGSSPELVAAYAQSNAAAKAFRDHAHAVVGEPPDCSKLSTVK